MLKNAADHRYSFDTHWGGSLDFVDYVVGRTSFIIDYEAILGDEFRLFDPNQGIYTLEAATSARVGDAEVVGIFHHVSRHLADRPNKQAIAWNHARRARLLSASPRTTTVDLDAEGGRVVQNAFVDYTWIGELNLWCGIPSTSTWPSLRRGPASCSRSTAPCPTGACRPAGLPRLASGSRAQAECSNCLRASKSGWTPIRSSASSQRWGLAGFRLLSR